MSDQVRDMTKGSPAKLILLFAVPLMLGNIFQQLYTMVIRSLSGRLPGFRLWLPLVRWNGSCGWYSAFLPELRRVFLF